MNELKSRGFSHSNLIISKQLMVRNTIVDPNNLDFIYNQPNFDNGNFTIATLEEILK
jgi:hypothetical protein